VWARTYLLTYNRFQQLCKADGFTIEVGDSKVKVSASKMTGLKELARMERSR